MIVRASMLAAVAKVDPYKYPQGKGRLEPLGVIVFAVVMGMSSLQEGWRRSHPVVAHPTAL
jgi:divalent metal cation (Fe/Co/Zn/Cd) transporter